MKPAFSDMVENDLLRKQLCRDICHGTLSHAYLLEGSAGYGKRMLALRIAMALACERKGHEDSALPCMICPSCKKILEGNSPDVMFIRREDKATIGVETIREIRGDISIAPNDLDTKVYIIEDAHLMTIQAQNALLLTLEEPPPYVLFLLLCEMLTPILETIRSRAPALRLRPVSPEIMRTHLISTSPEAAALSKSAPTELEELLAAAEGSIGRALSLLNPKQRQPIIAKRDAARKFIELSSARRNSAAALHFLNGISTKREELVEQLRIILLCLRDLLLCKQAEHAPLCFFTDHKEACEKAYGFTTPELLRLCDCVTAATDALQRNANMRLTLMQFAVNTGLLSTDA